VGTGGDVQAVRERELIEKAAAVLSKSYAEMPCYEMLKILVVPFPPEPFKEIPVDYIDVGDMVAFGEDPCDPHTPVGVYLGGEKVIASTIEHGVRIIPWRFVRKHFLWGGR
jgi:hypothetical protein